MGNSSKGPDGVTDSNKTERIDSEELYNRIQEISQQEKQRTEFLQLPLDKLDLSTADCRILFIPWTTDSTIVTVTGGEDYELTVVDQLRGDDPTRGCVVRVNQGASDTSCSLSSPLHLRIWYRADSDSVDIVNGTDRIVSFEPDTSLALNPVETPPLQCTPKGTLRVGPGAWSVRKHGQPSPSPLLRLVLFPRRHAVQLLPSRVPAAITGKRDRQDGHQYSREKSNSVDSQTISRKVDGPLRLAGGQKAHIVGGAKSDDSFDLTALRVLFEKSRATIFEARHSHFPEVIIVKTMRFRDEEKAKVRGLSWSREYKMGNMLQSDRIARLYGGDARIDSLFLERVSGHDLGTTRWRCQEAENWGYFLGTAEDARRVLFDVTGALQYLFENKVIHNDIRPENIMYSEARGAVLIDFGMSTTFGSGDVHGGTPWYLAPEFLANYERDAAADMWAAGIVMLYLFKSIKLPSAKKKTDPRDDIVDIFLLTKASIKAMRGWIRQVGEAKKTLPDDRLGRLVSRMLTNTATERITASELLQELEEFDKEHSNVMAARSS